MGTRLATALATLRRVAMMPILLRGVVAAMATIAIAATTLPAWDAPGGYVVVAVLAAIGYVCLPDSGSGVVFVSAVAVTWLTGAPGGVGPAVVVTALALLVGHVAAALAGSIPITAHADVALALHWARPSVAIGAGTVAAAAVVAVLDGISLPGSAVVTLAAIGAVTAGAWWWSATD
jgi:hypothetical protein